MDFPINSMVIFHGKMLVHQRVQYTIKLVGYGEIPMEGGSIWLWINTYFHTIFRGMNIHFNPAILM